MLIWVDFAAVLSLGERWLSMPEGVFVFLVPRMWVWWICVRCYVELIGVCVCVSYVVGG